MIINIFNYIKDDLIINNPFINKLQIKFFTNIKLKNKVYHKKETQIRYLIYIQIKMN